MLPLTGGGLMITYVTRGNATAGIITTAPCSAAGCLKQQDSLSCDVVFSARLLYCPLPFRMIVSLFFFFFFFFFFLDRSLDRIKIYYLLIHQPDGHLVPHRLRF